MSKPKIYVFDLDHTICIPNKEFDTKTRYGQAKPILNVIEKMQRLHALGHKIIIHTARRMLTFNGDVNKIIEDVGQITKDWLKRYNVPYDQLIFGKPYGDYYIDDKSLLLSDFLNSDIGDVS